MSALLPLAVLAPDHRTGAMWPVAEQAAGRLVAFQRSTCRGVVRVLGVERPFVIIVDPGHLRGLEVIGFVTQGLVPIALVEAARLQVRR